MLKNDDIPTELNKLSTVETYKIIKEVTVQLAHRKTALRAYRASRTLYG